MTNQAVLHGRDIGPRCFTCRWGTPQQTKMEDGNQRLMIQCRLNPPQMLITDKGAMVALWPVMAQADWCGQHKEKNSAFAPQV